jgi:hypothetical protein
VAPHDGVTPGHLVVVDREISVLATDDELLLDVHRQSSVGPTHYTQPCHSARSVLDAGRLLKPGQHRDLGGRRGTVRRMNGATARLEVVAGRAIGMSVMLDDELLIGRHAEGAGRLADDDEISRSHARISLDRSGFCAIEDLGSTNGTFVNGLRITGPQTLSVGDTIEVGGTTLVVRELPVPASERALKAVPPQPTVSPPTRPAAPSPSPSQATPLTTGPRSGAPDPASPAGPPTTPQQKDQGGGPAKLSLRLHIDFAARTATVAVDDGSEPLQLEFDGDAWRPASTS